MVLANNQGVFNLVDTNGRRSDLINGYSIYCNALYELGIVDDGHHRSKHHFTSYPHSLNQYRFYQKAFSRSEVFRKNHRYEEFFQALQEDSRLREAFSHLYGDKKRFPILKNLNNGIEDRARHYNNTLKSMGLSNSHNLLTANGLVFVDAKRLERDYLESQMFQGNLQNTNLMLMRQALKLKVFEHSDAKQKAHHRRYYRPIRLAMYLLLEQDNHPIPKGEMTKMLQNVNPQTAQDFTPQELVQIYQAEGCTRFLEKINQSEATQQIQQALAQYQDERLDQPTFLRYFKNRNSGQISEVYWKFYNAVYDVMLYRDPASVERLMEVNQKYQRNLRSAFGYDKTVLQKKRTPDFQTLLRNNPQFSLFRVPLAKFNVEFYRLFWNSKRHDKLKESLSGIFQIMDASKLFTTNSNQQISLNYADVFAQKPLFSRLADSIFGDDDVPSRWEENDDSPFFQSTSLMEIFDIHDPAQVDQILERAISGKANVEQVSDLHAYYAQQDERGFKHFVHENFPKERVMRILSLFSERDTNPSVDKQIKTLVYGRAQDAESDIPTIFEYIVGLAWYYLNDRGMDYDLYQSFNLSMGSDYLPLTHAAGGEGDIIVRYPDLDLMLEVTLMGEHSQKRGEWEPVLRHSVNLNTESQKPHQATLFIANRLDYNTINIWRAVAAVPLKESRDQHRLTDGRVKIMPLKNDELLRFAHDEHFSSERLINNIFRSFASVPQNTDDTWRQQILQNT